MNNLSGAAGIVTDGTGAYGARKWSGVNEYVYAYVAAATPKGAPKILSYDGDEEIMVSTQAPATLAVYQEVVVVPALQGSDASGQWCQVRGITECLTDGTTDIAKDDFLELLDTETALVKDSDARSVNSVAIACEAQTDATDTLTTVQLLGDRVIIAAS